jgi:hypothetical protein
MPTDRPTVTVTDDLVISIEPDHRPQREDPTPLYIIHTDGRSPFPEFDLGERSGLLFGDWLVRRDLISRAQLFHALHLARSTGCRIGDAVVDLSLLERARVEEEACALGTFNAFVRG